VGDEFLAIDQHAQNHCLQVVFRQGLFGDRHDLAGRRAGHRGRVLGHTAPREGQWEQCTASDDGASRHNRAPRNRKGGEEVGRQIVHRLFSR
jgi:hypothetical protein